MTIRYAYAGHLAGSNSHGMTLGNQVVQCNLCGAIVGNPNIHDEVHRRGTEDPSAAANGDSNMTVFWQRYLAWAKSTVLNNQTAEAMLSKFREEAGEFLLEPSVEEAIDCMAVLVFWCDRNDITPADIVTKAYEKLGEWHLRKWALSGDGSYHHV